MANLKQIRKHIASVQNTEKITKAMKMVAVSKLRKSQKAVVETRPYVNELINVIEHLIAKAEGSRHPMLRNPEVRKNAVLVVVSGDKGLCGAYNHNIVKSARRFIDEHKGQYENLKLIFLGRKAHEAMQRTEGVEKEWISDAWTKKPEALALEISKKLCDDFVEGKVDEVFILYTVFKSAIAQRVVLDGLLPLQSIIQNTDADGHALVTDEEKERLSETSYIYEPSNHEILDMLLPRVVGIHMQRSLLESLASENGARMTAMDSASKNAFEMIGRLTLQFNHARQAAITTELTEVVSGAEAL